MFQSLTSHLSRCRTAGYTNPNLNQQERCHVQWSLSYPVTFGPKIFGLITDVAAMTITFLRVVTKKKLHFMEAHHL